MTNKKILWSLPAKNDLQAIFEFTFEQSKNLQISQTLKQKIYEQVLILEYFPFLGRIVPEVNDTNLREILCFRFRVIYSIKNSTIYILAIIGISQQIDASFLE
jgi:toxin ParE1/3/4